MTDLERLARAVCHSAPRCSQMCMACHADVLSILAELRTPSEGMVKGSIGRYFGEHDKQGKLLLEEPVRGAFTAMIDHIIAQEPKT